MKERAEVMSHTPKTQKLSFQVKDDQLESHRLHEACPGLFDICPLICPLIFINGATFCILLIKFTY